ncbi:HAD family hydrolase [Flavobacterium gawalongense]|uniref:HAD family phosphatase n=1 Tax=Flavobacterium gawalongense TaxID=2594432 RepID=A0A553BQS1_9FLAO|nr:HAD family phosphatase [Flavobacterium gawalongense]TRW99795.1 HAD family phosphatase [Flavobacterium gawalongense]TRX04101.1 HAD family phosphatase [Flavobacterium gawalongense]TRX10586.1 HAD family phosphatase [Flavobacterium gawalongense]TRX11735.1 HAD family phosphatase [Flavobacterium gawalongense]TRX29527.1 HAD family phosphatase [Flavobacterium gawalongense]
MINAIIFDFGDIFINLDKQATMDALEKLGLSEWNEDLDHLNIQFETGQISRENFLLGIQKHVPNASIKEILAAWNAILLDFPLYRLEFLQMLSKKYRLFLLSNTDSIHIETFEQKNGISFYSDFYQCFEKVYFSFEVEMRKPNPEIFNYLANKHDLAPKRTLFIDDKKENTDAALALGFQVWNLQVGKEDVVNLFDKKII